MKITGTKEAFQYLISKKDIHKELNVSAPLISRWRTGCSASEKTMIKYLVRARSVVIKNNVVWDVK